MRVIKDFLFNYLSMWQMEESKPSILPAEYLLLCIVIYGCLFYCRLPLVLLLKDQLWVSWSSGMNYMEKEVQGRNSSSLTSFRIYKAGKLWTSQHSSKGNLQHVEVALMAGDQKFKACQSVALKSNAKRSCQSQKSLSLGRYPPNVVCSSSYHTSCLGEGSW